MQKVSCKHYEWKDNFQFFFFSIKKEIWIKEKEKDFQEKWMHSQCNSPKLTHNTMKSAKTRKLIYWINKIKIRFLINNNQKLRKYHEQLDLQALKDESKRLYPWNNKWKIELWGLWEDFQNLKNDQDQLKIANQAVNNHSTRPKIHPKKW